MRKLLAALLLLTCAAFAGTVTGTIVYPSGSGVQNGTVTFTPSQTFYVSGSFVVVSASSSCYTSTDGSVVGLPNALASPLNSISAGSGSLTAATYYLKVTYWNATGETLASPEVAVVVGSTPSRIVVSAPALQPSNASGYKIYASNASGTETLQATITGWASSNVDALVSGSALPGANSSTCALVFNDTGIPSYTTYSTSVVDSSGRIVTGYPQNYYFQGSTANLSTLTPAGNLAANFPSAIVSNPSGHATQSVNGPLTTNGYAVSTGALTATTFESYRFADQFTGSDIGAKVNAAFADCSNACTVIVPAGSYSYSTTINYPMASSGKAALVLDSAAILTYTGSGYGIDAAGTGQAAANVNVSGGRIIGTSSGLAGIHLQAFNRGIIKAVRIDSFSTGACLLNEGANAVDFIGLTLKNCQDGIRQVGKTVSAVNYAPNGNKVIGGYIVGNTRWGVYEDGTQSGTSGPNLGNVYTTTFDLNGTNGFTLSGHMFIQNASGASVNGSYFEYVSGSTVPNAITIGDGTYAPTGISIRNNVFQSAGATSTILNTNGQSLFIDGNSENASVTNFVNNATSERGLFLGSNRAPAATNYLGGTDSGGDSYVYGSGSSTRQNAMSPTTNGLGFTSLTGLAGDLIVRTRTGGTNALNLQNIVGSSIGSITNAGLATFNGGANLNNAGLAAVGALSGATTAAFSTSVTVGASGTPLLQNKKFTVVLTGGSAPASVGASTSAEQAFTATGLTSSDIVTCNPTFNAAANAAVPTYFRAGTDVLVVTFTNPTAGALTPTAGTYICSASRY